MDRTVLRTKKTVHISCFDRGGAGRVFDALDHDGPTIVMENDHPVCVLLSPEQYEVMIEMLSDTLLLKVKNRCIKCKFAFDSEKIKPEAHEPWLRVNFELHQGDKERYL